MAASTVFRSPLHRVDLANHYNWWTYVPGAEYAWGEELTPDGRWMANTWQGEFPVENLGLDGHAGTAPVGRFPPNGYGLLDMIGNVWDQSTPERPTSGSAASSGCDCGEASRRYGPRGALTTEHKALLDRAHDLASSRNAAGTQTVHTGTRSRGGAAQPEVSWVQRGPWR